jgi:hypothetical protein
MALGVWSLLAVVSCASLVSCAAQAQGGHSVLASGANATLTVLSALYGANCDASPVGDVTPAVGAFCDGTPSCSYSLCICGYDKNCSAAPPCVPDPAPACAKDFRVTWRCSTDADGVNRSAALPAEADLSTITLGCGPPPSVFTPRNVTVAAFVYDPWTPEAAAFGTHGPNWTEWELVRHATPRFPGHLQPKVPLWGELDTSLPATWDLLNGAALAAGIEVYLWDWYWWSDAPSNPLLVRGLEQGFLRSASAHKMRWAVMWANQDWEELFPARRKATPPVIYSGVTNSSVFSALSQYWIDTYFPLANYLAVPDAAGGTSACPLVSIYQIDVLVSSLGGLGPAAAALADFRARAASSGHRCVHVQVQGFGARSLPPPLATTLQALGVDSVTDYCPQHYAGMSGFPLVDYAAYARSYTTRYGELAAQVAPLPYMPNFGVAWDPSPRTIQSDYFDAWGYPATPVLQPTLPEFAAAIADAAATVAARCTAAWCWMSVYAYTEFSEGGSLWPTVTDGMGRLDAFTAVFGNRSA